eukprot:1967343-Prymnesium_polylepis.1
MSTLERYKRHYRLKTRQNVTKAELAKAIVKHFSTQTVNESDTINLRARPGNARRGVQSSQRADGRASHGRWPCGEERGVCRRPYE